MAARALMHDGSLGSYREEVVGPLLHSFYAQVLSVKLAGSLTEDVMAERPQLTCRLIIILYFRIYIVVHHPAHIYYSHSDNKISFQ